MEALTEKPPEKITPEAIRGELFPRKGFFSEENETPSEIYKEEGGFCLYLGDSIDARNLAKLDKKQITYILNVASGEIRTENIYDDKYNFLGIPMEDVENYDVSRRMDDALGFIERARSNKAGILVHCAAGVSRSATVVLAYLMLNKGWSLKKAARITGRKRAAAYPNIGFFEYLVRIDKERH